MVFYIPLQIGQKNSKRRRGIGCRAQSAGGDICTHAVPLLKPGGTIVTYVGPRRPPFTMQLSQGWSI